MSDLVLDTERGGLADRLPSTVWGWIWTGLGALAGLIFIIEIASTRRPLGFSLAAGFANGLQSGAVYALIALGVALIYRATKVVNFAQGELGSFPAFLVLWALASFNLEAFDGEFSKWQFIAYAVVAVVFGAALAVAINLGVVRVLKNASPVTSLVATAGLTLLLIAVQIIMFGANRFSYPRFISGAPGGFELGPFCFAQISDGACDPTGQFALGGQVVPWNTFLVLAVLGIVSAALAVFFRTPAGVALLATAQEPYAAELYGVNPALMSSLAWAAAGAFGALAGILGAGVFEGATPGFMTASFLLQGLVAAVLGGITSMVGAVVGGLIVGMVFSLANFLTFQYDALSFIPGPSFLAVFMVLVLVLLVRPNGLLGKEA